MKRKGLLSHASKLPVCLVPLFCLLLFGPMIVAFIICFFTIDKKHEYKRFKICSVRNEWLSDNSNLEIIRNEGTI